MSIENETAQLPIWQTLRSAILIVTERWRSLLNALLVPALLIVLLNFIYQFSLAAALAELRSESTSSSLAGFHLIATIFLSFLVHGLLSAIIAVSCHRITLLDGKALPGRWGLYWSRRETRFFGWMMLFAIPITLASVAFILVLPLLTNTLHIEISWWSWQSLQRLSVISGTIAVTATFGLVLPLTAIDRKVSLRIAWRQMHGNILRLAVVLAIPMLLIWGISRTTYGLLDGSGGAGILALLQLEFILISAFEIIVLSVSYQQLATAKNRG